MATSSERNSASGSVVLRVKRKRDENPAEAIQVFTQNSGKKAKFSFGVTTKEILEDVEKSQSESGGSGNGKAEAEFEAEMRLEQILFGRQIG